MKYPILLLSVLTVAFTLPAGPYNLEEIATAIRKGDANALASYFNATVELVVKGKEGMHTRENARKEVADFFATHRPTSFSVVHKGEARGRASTYCIGDLVTNQQTFRVYIYMKQVGSETRIVELRFDQ